jgi:hypothetical protein
MGRSADGQPMIDRAGAHQEIGAIGKARGAGSNGSNDERESILNRLLVEAEPVGPDGLLAAQAGPRQADEDERASGPFRRRACEPKKSTEPDQQRLPTKRLRLT